MFTPNDLLHLTELIKPHWSSAVRVHPVETLDSQYIVNRCQVLDAHNTVLGSVIVKKWQAQYEPSPYQAPPSQARFLREHDSLSFLSKLDTTPPVAPRLLASEREAGLLVIEDLGQHPTVQDIVFGDNPTQAELALRLQGEYLGRLHSATLGKQAEFETLVSGAKPDHVDAALDMRERYAHLEKSYQLMKLDLPAQMKSWLDTLETPLHDPTDFNVLTHCDAGAHNVLYMRDVVRLMDFEFARYANGFLDIACIRLGFPVAFKAYRVPPSVGEVAEQAYRQVIIQVLPAAQDDRWFYGMMARACTHWALTNLTGIARYLEPRLATGPSFDNEGGRKPEVMSMFRNKCFTLIEVALETAETFTFLPELHRVIAQWRNQFLKYFPETDLLPSFPAFRT